MLNSPKTMLTMMMAVTKTAFCNNLLFSLLTETLCYNDASNGRQMDVILMADGN